MNRTEKEQIVFGNILLLSNKLQILGDNILPELTLKQWFLLIVMSKLENKSPSVNDIAEIMGSTRQNIKKILLPLESKGFVEISKSEKDSRALSIALTKKAYHYFNDMEQLAEINTNKLFRAISDNELDTFHKVLEELFFSVEHFRDGEEM